MTAGTPATAGTQGWTAPGWEGVRAAFDRNFEKGLEIGAAFSAYHRGKQVVDLWGGHADARVGRPWVHDTMVLVYSTTKGATAMCANVLADQGALDVAAPVAAYWPEFATAGKAGIPVSYLLSHRAGLAWTDGTMTADEALAWHPVIRTLEAQVPVWEPGTRHGYHATTFGWLVGEVVRRIRGTSFGTAFRELVAEPLDLDFYIGLPEDEEHRVARLHAGLPSTGGPTPAADATAEPAEAGAHLEDLLVELFGADAPLPMALFAPGNALADHDLWNSRRMRAAEVPAANGVGDARSIARMYAAGVGEVVTPSGRTVRLLSPGQLARATEQQTVGPDVVILDVDLQFGLGFMLNRGIAESMPLGGPRSFGHHGLGGSVGWADPDTGLAIGYVTNKMELGLTGDARCFRLAKAANAAAAVMG